MVITARPKQELNAQGALYEYDPHLHRIIENPLTNFGAFVSVLKSTIGTGCLAMPLAFYYAGWLNGIISTIIIMIILVHAVHILIDDIHELCRRYNVHVMTYPEAMYLGLKEGPNFLWIFSVPAMVLTDVILAVYYFGTCFIYVIFIAESINTCCTSFGLVLDLRIYMSLLIVPFILIFSVRSINTLVPLTVLANVLLMASFAIILSYIAEGLAPVKEREAFQNLKYYPLYFGMMMFAVESIGVLLVIEQHMVEPKYFLGTFGILNCGMSIVAVLYSAFGTLGYLRYGADVNGNIMMNLPNEGFSLIATLMFAISVLISYALQGLVIMDVVWEHYLRPLIADHVLLMESFTRILIVLLSVISAMFSHRIGDILSLIGSLCLPMLGLIFPALLDVCVRYKSGYGNFKKYLIRDTIIMLFGLVGTIVGTLTALVDIIYDKDEMLRF